MIRTVLSTIPTVAAALVAALGPGALAEPAGPPAPDARIEGVIDRLVGYYSDQEHRLRIANVLATDLHRVVYVEMTRSGSPLHPMWQQFWSFSVVDDAVQARVSEFPRGTPYSSVYAGAWAAPDLFPRVTFEMLDVMGDLDVSQDDATVLLESTHPMPLFRAGAVEMMMKISADAALEWSAVGFGPDGRPLWGERPLTLVRGEEPAVMDVGPRGLVVIDFVVGQGPRTAEGDTIHTSFTGRLINGFIFDAHDRPRRNRTIPIPGDFPAGWNMGVLGVQAGGVRRIVIPPDLGAREHGIPSMQIPPNAWLIYDLEVVSVKDNTPDIEEPELLPPPANVPD